MDRGDPSLYYGSIKQHHFMGFNIKITASGVPESGHYATKSGSRRREVSMRHVIAPMNEKKVSGSLPEWISSDYGGTRGTR